MRGPAGILDLCRNTTHLVRPEWGACSGNRCGLSTEDVLTARDDPANPLDDIHNTRTLETVIPEGAVHDRPSPRDLP